MDKKTALLFLCLFLLFGAGSYLMLDNIHSLRNEVKNLELNLQILSKKDEQLPPSVPEKPAEEISRPQTPEDSESVSIPTSIIFAAQSSPLLSPQTKLTVTLENTTKAKDGTITLNIKVFTNEAVSYSAFEPRDYFQIINLEGADQKAARTAGQFNSMPPKSSISGSLIFKIEPAQNTIILQVGPTENAVFYEFNFLKKTYKETFLG